MELPSATILSAAYDLLQGLPFGAPTFRRPRCGSALCFLTPGSDHDEPLQSCDPPPQSPSIRGAGGAEQGAACDQGLPRARRND